MLTNKKTELFSPGKIWNFLTWVDIGVLRLFPQFDYFCFALLAVLLILPVLIEIASPSYILVFFLGVFICVLLSLGESNQDRKYFYRFYFWSFLIRFVSLILFHVTLKFTSINFPNPDAEGYYAISKWLANQNEFIDIRSNNFVGTWDVGYYYLNAFLIEFLSADLFALKFLNVILGALIVPLLFLYCKILKIRHAHLIAAIGMFSPSLIYGNSFDLLKDTSILFVLILFLWSFSKIIGCCEGVLPSNTYISCRAIFHFKWVVKIWEFFTSHERLHLSWLSLLGCVVGAGASLFFLRFTRIYIVFFVEAAFVIVLLVSLPLFFRIKSIWRVSVVMICIFLAVELITFRLGQPYSPEYFLSQIGYVLNEPLMVEYQKGKFQNQVLQKFVENMKVILETKWDIDGIQWAGSLLSLGINLFRKVFAPFPWVMPKEWTIRHLIYGDYFLYPGMVGFYFGFPFMVMGLGSEFKNMLLFGGNRKKFKRIFLGIFLLIYICFYLSINLSYRQRGIIIPFLLIYGYWGALSIRNGRRAAIYFAVYFSFLVLVAITHLLIK